MLCVEASDKQDPQRRVTPTNRELKAQGIGNIISGLIGGLPITQVIVRSSVNVQANAKTKASAIFHGFLILFSVMFIPELLNKIDRIEHIYKKISNVPPLLFEVLEQQKQRLQETKAKFGEYISPFVFVK